MAWLGTATAIAIIGLVLLDAFEVVLLPRRVRHSYRLARLFYRSAWVLWRGLARRLPAGRWRQGLLSAFGPLSLLALLALWATGLIAGFALLHWSLGTPVSFPHDSDGGFGAYLYF